MKSARIINVLSSLYFSELGWNLGSIVMTLLAYLLRDWSSLQLSFAIASLFLISYFFFVPESPRWLLGQGKVEKAEGIFRKIAKVNGVRDLEAFEKNFQRLKLKLKQEEEERKSG